MATVTMGDVNKDDENGFHAIHDLSLEIAESEFRVLVGPSGGGKSTALRRRPRFHQLMRYPFGR